METLWIEIVLIAVAIVANGFFSGSEIALVSARIARLAELRRAGVRGAATALALKESPESFLATIQIAISLVGALASAVGGAAAIERLTPVLAALPVPGARAWAEPVSLGLVILAIAYFSLVIGELVPKAIALRDPERLSCLIAPVIRRLSRAARWIVAALTVSTNVVLRLLGQGRARESPFVSEEEVKYLLREGTARGVFEKVEEELVHNAFEFADTVVRDIMVPRTQIVGLDVETPPDELLRRADDTGHSRIPVYRGSVDNVIGIVGIRRLFRAVARGEPVLLASLLHPPRFIPETARISAVLREFQRTQQQVALVVDEYGAVVGLVTLEDVLEEIVGEIRAEGERAPTYIISRTATAVVIQGITPLRLLRETGITVPETADYTTAAGLVMHLLGAVPRPGASAAYGNRRFTVLDMTGPQITRIRIETTAAGEVGR
jgi:putative hemolysin